MKIKSSFNISKWNGPTLRMRALTIFKRYCFKAAEKFKDEIRAVQFTGFPNITIRKNGQPVFNPRDIVDTGAFLASQSEPQFVNVTTCVFTWNVPYSSLILTGYTTPKGHRIPGRNWIRPVTEDKFPMERYFEAEWKKLERQR